MKWARRTHQRWRRWLYRQRGYDVLSIKVRISSDLLEDGNPLTADLIAQTVEQRARDATMKRMGLVSS